MDLRNKKVTVVGLGESGIKSTLLLEKNGAIVSVTDSGDTESVKKNAELLKAKYVDLELSKHTESFLHDTELLVVSPGVEDSSVPVQFALKNNIPIISELELGYRFCKGIIVAITGTNGKSTVVSLLGKIFESAGFPFVVCGNIGNSLSGETEKINSDTRVILETSSFQLEHIEEFRPKISVILNIAEDHLDRYKDFASYLDTKKKIFKNQKEDDIVVLNKDDESLMRLGASLKVLPKVLYFSAKGPTDGIYLEGKNIKISIRDKAKTLFSVFESNLKGKHNLENILVSILVATLLGVKEYIIEKAVRDFKPLAHRFEHVATIKGVEFIDDSKATNVDSAFRALGSLDKPAILIAGGKDKGLSYEKALPAIKKHVKKLILIGETKEKMKAIFGKSVPVEEAGTLSDAVGLSYKNASPGDSVLLSPMCSSFDMFKDYKERGEVFKKAVEKLKEKA